MYLHRSRCARFQNQTRALGLNGRLGWHGARTRTRTSTLRVQRKITDIPDTPATPGHRKYCQTPSPAHATLRDAPGCLMRPAPLQRVSLCLMPVGNRTSTAFFLSVEAGFWCWYDSRTVSAGFTYLGACRFLVVLGDPSIMGRIRSDYNVGADLPWSLGVMAVLKLQI